MNVSKQVTTLPACGVSETSILVAADRALGPGPHLKPWGCSLSSAWLGCEQDVLPCCSTTQVSRLAAAILVGQLKGNALPQGVEIAHQLCQGTGGAHGRGVGTGGIDQAKYLKLLGVVQSLRVAHQRLPSPSWAA